MSYGEGIIDERRTKGGAIRHRVRVPDGRGDYVTLGTYATPAEAEAMREGGLKARAEIGVGVTLEQWGEEWLRMIAGQKAIRSVRSLWRTIIADAPFYREPLDTLTQAEVEDWVAALPKKRCKRSVLRVGKRVTEEMDRTLSQQMIKHALRKLQLCLDAAKKKGLVSENVARGVELPEQERIEDTWTHLERSEIDAVFKLELSEEQRAAFSVAVYQGLRVGEVAALTWECLRLDDDAPRVEVRRSWKGRTKTGKPRTVPLMPAAREALARWQTVSGRKAGLELRRPM